jgi:hypothetical protein
MYFHFAGLYVLSQKSFEASHYFSSLALGPSISHSMGFSGESKALRPHPVAEALFWPFSLTPLRL